MTSSQTRTPRGRRPKRGVGRGSPMLRLRIGFVVIAMGLSVFAARLVQLQGVDPGSYAEMATAESTVRVVLPAVRGDILDRRGQAFASSVEGMMVVADPWVTKEQAPELATFLSDELGVDYFGTLSRLRAVDSQFEYIARRVPSTIATDVLAKADDAGFTGLSLRPDPVRDYPAEDVAANLVGFLGTDEPLEGFERTFDPLLAGEDGEATYQAGTWGGQIPLADATRVPPKDGTDLTTTLDLDLQWYAQARLRQAVEDAGGESGVAVVMDTRTGALLALADYPSYDASDPLQTEKEDLGSRALRDVYEPGSVEKAVTFAALLDAGVVTPRSKILVPPQLVQDGQATIGDWFDHGTLRLTATGVLAKSSNIGTVLASKRMPGRLLRDYLVRFGLTRPTNMGVTGESSGTTPRGPALDDATKDRVTFGQSMSVNSVQMTAAINTIANDGVYVSPNVISGSAETRSGKVVGTDTARVEQVVSPEAAHQTARMMERVLDPEDGTASGAAVPGYRVAGKTGTAERVDPECDCYNGTTVSFAGFAPADDPRFTIYVVVHNPSNGGGGASVAGPVFSKLMGYALRRYQVPPTDTRPSNLPVSWGGGPS